MAEGHTDRFRSKDSALPFCYYGGRQTPRAVWLFVFASLSVVAILLRST
jgi:hypothetical protein